MTPVSCTTSTSLRTWSASGRIRARRRAVVACALNRRRPVSNEVQAIFGSMPALLQQVKANKLRPLAVGTARRSPAVPDVPTVAELGDPGFEAALWLGIVAPAGTPARAVERLNCPCRPLLSLYPLDLARISERTTARPMLGARCCGVNETCGARARRGKDLRALSCDQSPWYQPGRRCLSMDSGPNCSANPLPTARNAAASARPIFCRRRGRGAGSDSTTSLGACA